MAKADVFPGERDTFLHVRSRVPHKPPHAPTLRDSLGYTWVLLDRIPRSQARILGTILNAPPFLSGLNDTEFDLIRQRARTALHAEQSQMQDRLKKTLAELQEGVAATKRMVIARCKLVERDYVVQIG